MSAATIAEPDVKEQDEAFYRPSKQHREPLFNPEQQRIFDRELSKAKRKIRDEYGRMCGDLLDTVGITEQLLELCKDRVSQEDEVAIRDGLQSIRREYQKWQKRK